MKFIIINVALLVLASAGVNAETRAQQECKNIHHVDIDPSGTEFVNNNCRLNCNVHGKVYYHNINEGHTCLIGQNRYVCRGGQCIGSGNSVGHVDVEFISASLYSNANAYATACINNSSMPVHLPLTADERRNCVTCSSNYRSNTNYPVWNEMCSGTGRYIFVNNARVTIEVWDHHGQGNNEFIGGITLTIDQLLSHGDNNRVIHMAMAGGRNPGQVTTRITWTPRN